MARPKGFKRGGGRLNDVDVTITGYRLTDEFRGEAFVPGKMPSFDNPKKLVDKPHNLNLEITLLPDGAEEGIAEPLRISKDYDAWTVSADEQTISPVEPGTTLMNGTPGATFLESLATKAAADLGEDYPEGFDDLWNSDSPDDEISFASIVGVRCRVAQIKNDERTQKFGQRKGKKGGAFDRTDFVVTHVYSIDAPKPKKAAGKAVPAAKVTGKAGKAAPVEVDYDEAAHVKLLQLLEAADGNTIAKNRIRVAIMTDPAYKNDPTLAQEIVKRLTNDVVLKGYDDVTLDKGILSLVGVDA